MLQTPTATSSVVTRSQRSYLTGTMVTLLVCQVSAAVLPVQHRMTSEHPAPTVAATSNDNELLSNSDRLQSTASVLQRRLHAATVQAMSVNVPWSQSPGPAVPETAQGLLLGDRGIRIVDGRGNNGAGDVGSKNRTASSRCREGCLEQRSIKDILCTQQRDCSMCWDVCSRNHQIRKENELAHKLLLSLVRIIRNESVVTAEIEWTTPEELLEHQPHPVVPSPLAATENVERLSRIARDGANGTSSVSKIMQALTQASSLLNRQETRLPTSSQDYHQCLVSWEISGGGLTGNLLTETSTVELSLWPNTKYHVHVTCRNKESDSLIRSSPLIIDTRDAVIVSLQRTTSTTPRPQSINSATVMERRFDRTDESFSNSNTSRTDLFIPMVSEQPASGSTENQEASRSNVHQHYIWSFDSTELVNNSKEMVLLGVFVALLGFFLITLTVVILVRRKQELLEDSEHLIENEVLHKILHV